MSQKSIADLQAEISAAIIDNNAGLITPAVLRNAINQLIAGEYVALNAPRVDNALLRFDGTDANATQGSVVTVDDLGNFAAIKSLVFTLGHGVTETTDGLRIDRGLGVGDDVGPSQRLSVFAGDPDAATLGTASAGVRSEVWDRASSRSVQVKSFHAKVIVGSKAQDDHFDIGYLAEMETYDDTTGASAHCCFITSGYKFAAADIFLGSLAGFDLNIFAAPADTTAMTGLEIGVGFFGQDDPTAVNNTGVRELLRVSVRDAAEALIHIGGIACGATTVVTTTVPHALVDDDHAWVKSIVGTVAAALNNLEWLVDNRGGGGNRNIASVAVAVNGKITIATTAPHGRTNGDAVWIAGITGMTYLNGKVFLVSEANASDFVLAPVDNKHPLAWIDGTDLSPADPTTGTVTWYTTFELRTLAGAAVDTTALAWTSDGVVQRIAEAGKGVHIRPNVDGYSRYRYGLLYQDAISGWDNPLSAGVAAIGIDTGAPAALLFRGSPVRAIDLRSATPTTAAIALDTSHEIQFGANTVLKSRRTGWGAVSGTLDRTAYDSGTANATKVAQTLAALLTDLYGPSGMGIIGA